MKLGSHKTINGIKHICLRTKLGKPIWQPVAPKPRFELGEMVKIVNLTKEPMAGIITSVSPLKAKVITQDRIWHGAEIDYPSRIRKQVVK